MSETKSMSLGELLPQEGLNKLMEAMHGDYETGEDFHKGLVGVLAEYKDTLQEKGVDHEYLAYAIEAKMMKSAKPVYKPGMRVHVYDGTGEKDLGEGTYEGNVKVYFFAMPDGNLQSLEDAEKEPAPELVPPGAEVVCSEDNPKIRLDSGKVVYGCQVWWEAVEHKHEHGENCGCHG